MVSDPKGRSVDEDAEGTVSVGKVGSFHRPDRPCSLVRTVLQDPLGSSLTRKSVYGGDSPPPGHTLVSEVDDDNDGPLVSVAPEHLLVRGQPRRTRRSRASSVGGL